MSKPAQATLYADIATFAAMTSAQLRALSFQDIVTWIAITGMVELNPSDPNYTNVNTAYANLVGELSNRNVDRRWSRLFQHMGG